MKIQLCLVLIFYVAYASAQDPYVLDSLKEKIQQAPNDSLQCEARIDLALFLYAGDEAVQYARDALKIAKEQKPHLILLDCEMPIMDGQEACRKVNCL